MTSPRLPAVRMTPGGECIFQESVPLNLSSSSKFCISYAPSDMHQTSLLPNTSTLNDHTTLSSSESGPHSSDGESGDESIPSPVETEPNKSAPATLNQQTFLRMGFMPGDSSNPGAISRTLSMPLPSQLNQLQHPHRPAGPPSIVHSSPTVPSAESAHIREVSMELADSIQLVIQTMLRISPPQVLDPAKEQFSACALSVPTSSMSAMFTAMKNINYISANMISFCDQAMIGNRSADAISPQERADAKKAHNEFDIGELLQCVGDALSGLAAQVGVDLVIYHGDVGLKHVYVSGDESGIGFTLTHIVRQVLSSAERGDSIELGLLVTQISNPAPPLSACPESPPIDDLLSAAPLESNGPVRITIRISHKYAPSETHQGGEHPKDVVTTEIRPKPSFSTLFLRRILRQIDGQLVSDLPPPEAFTSGRTCDLELVLDRVPTPIHPHIGEDNQDGTTNTEPTLELLSTFGESLKGKKVTLYASAKGSFAHHLSSYLTAWGMEITHVSPDGQVDGLNLAEQVSFSPDEDRSSLFNPFSTQQESASRSRAGSQTKSCPPARTSFIVIDDDIDSLRDRLQALRFENNQPSVLLQNARKRPSLSALHRPKSSPHMARLFGTANTTHPLPPIVILHFTSLTNYKVVRDVMQSITLSYTATNTPLPEVMIIPKPAGPRRFLTALHTAVTKPTVDPSFIPIATSPISPDVINAPGSFFSSTPSESGSQHNGESSSRASSQAQSPTTKNATRPPGNPRTNSERPTRPNEAASGVSAMVPPSPLALPENVEYFSAAAHQLGTSPSSGLVIQSPDGQTAGIYFHPRSKNASRNASSQSMERDRGQLSVPSPRRGSTPRVPSGGAKREDKAIPFSSWKEGNNSASSSSTTILAPTPTKINEPRKVASPIESPIERISTPSRRSGKRNLDTKDQSPAALRKGAKPVDANVVPPISVLIVDDNPINQTILSTFMRRKKIKYDLASNGHEAVQKWRTGGFHLILMDIQMPVMDGIQATKEIRRLEKSNAAAGFPPGSPSTDEGHTPSEKYPLSASSSVTSETRSMNSPYRSSVIIVALTASSLQTDRVAALAAGCNDFLTKPVSLLWLNNKIIEWGSIKALQMWADIRPDAVKTMTTGQAAKARDVAQRLHVPPKMKASPPPQAMRRTTTILEDNAAALALASSTGSIPNLSSSLQNTPGSPVTPLFRGPDRPPSSASQTTQPSVFDTSSLSDSLDFQPFKRKSAGSTHGLSSFVLPYYFLLK
ncbi:hypothetical protein M413DRAFT_80030 [Hebeloma cylindrosporum]|uniref:Response regulatory domain-containing protein n=1 Tax=Hebeloma cylindrosporum TaxID=76867 RepID=A0A0C3BTV3_HEBCY|nr:hypothetical protein M413DRAFT_80051 [Hebeloma cylindrosporum h7]KIM34796.1 hypothetical protein M413DRAFT_80030 [Hebeloma cylindrosporum h7]